MSADVINLRRARKQKARSERERQAEANRLRFGRSKEERQQEAATKSLEDRRLDGSRRDTGDAGDRKTD